MPGKADDRNKAHEARDLLIAALGDWWKDDRRRWCAYCGVAMKLRCARGKPIPGNKSTRDHVIPRKHNGGGRTIPACRDCNEARGTQSLPEFLRDAHFTTRRKPGHRNKWPVEQLWMVTALAALESAVGG